MWLGSLPSVGLLLSRGAPRGLLSGMRPSDSSLFDPAYLQAVACRDEGLGELASYFRTYFGRPRAALNVFHYSLSSVRDALVLSGFRVCVRVGGCAPKVFLAEVWGLGPWPLRRDLS